MQTNFGWLDSAIILAYLGMLIGIGVYFSRKQKNLEDFFVAGRSYGWLPIGLSLMAALNSGIDYIAGPSTTILYGLIFVVAVVSWIFLYPWAAYVTLPFYRRLEVISAYEYLERRVNVAVRSLAAMIFLLWRLGWMATAIYVPCLAIEAVSGKRVSVTTLILVLGSVVTLYTMLGGIKAVIWTDVIQFIIMFTGLAVTMWVISSHVEGGIAGVWTTAAAAGKTAFTYSDPALANASFWEQTKAFFTDSRSAVAIVIAVVVGRMAVYTSDQVMIQRFQTTRTLRDARQAFIINGAGDAVWTVGLAFVGLALFAYFQANTLPANVKPDEIFPYFMSTVFPTGVVGLVVAAVLAASLSSIDSAINSCTSVVMVDFHNRLLLRRDDHAPAFTVNEQRRQVVTSRVATLVVGLVGTLLSTQVAQLGNLIEIGNKVIQTLTGPILGIFLLGMFSRRANSIGALAGGAVGAVTAIYVAFGTDIGFIFPTLFGLSSTLLVGMVVSMITGGNDSDELTWQRVMQRPEVGSRHANDASSDADRKPVLERA